jgi:hypothetical protein
MTLRRTIAALMLVAGLSFGTAVRPDTSPSQYLVAQYPGGGLIKA